MSIGADDGRGGAGVVDTRRGAFFALQSVPVGSVALWDGFWGPRLKTNVEASIPALLAEIEQHGGVDNFRRLTGSKQCERRGPLYTDSDLYKWIEAVGIAMQSGPLPEMKQAVADITGEIAAAQGEDGYLSTYYVEDRADLRFTQLEHSHEMYCAGHLMQAAVAIHRATGAKELLNVARGFADYLDEVFGPGKNETTDGHPEIELALIELYRATGKKQYLALAGFFLSRPQSLGNLPPIARRPELIGHCVRSGYICAAGADYYAETGDDGMLSNLSLLWDDLVNRKMYITGGVGAHHLGEEFGEAYELPASRAYAETCAQIAHAMWAWRMLLISGDAKFGDVLERILYNGFLSGVSLEGTEYFYSNPLAANPGGATHRSSQGKWLRQSWWSTTCCPPNVQRTLASIPGMIMTTSSEGIQIHLYDACWARMALQDGTAVDVRVETSYPWDGEIAITLEPERESEFALMMRIPAWAKGATAEINGEPEQQEIEPGSYLYLDRVWREGDTVKLHLPMAVRFTRAHPYVADGRGCVAIERGPIVYCIESADNISAPVADLHIPAEKLTPDAWVVEHRPELLGGVCVVRGPGLKPVPSFAGFRLYEDVTDSEFEKWTETEITAIPYYAWANRGEGQMRVWMPVTEC